MKVLIAGAGIAGLASAIALARKGHEVTVHEQATRLEAIGAGLQLGPNAVRMLKTLGVWEQLEPACVAPARIRICDARNSRQLTAIELGQNFTTRFGAPYRVAHRADLIDALAATAATHDGINIVTGNRVTGLGNGPDATLKLLSGETGSADLIVAADGIRSCLRNHIAPGNGIRRSGQTLYRALAPASTLPAALDPEAVYLWLAPEGHVVHYPVSRGRRMNVVASIEHSSETSGWNSFAKVDVILACLPNLCSPLRDVLTAPASWLQWSGADIEPMTGWSRNNCVLVGDAAHASLPYLAQGAAMALEDAVVLAGKLGDGSNVPDALAAFETVRQPRTARITRESRRNGKVYHMDGAPSAARNLAIRLMPQSLHLRRLAWIYQAQ